MVRAILIVICFISFIIFLRPLTFTHYPDFAVYYQAAHTALIEGNPYLSTTDTFLYPPIALLFFLPLTVLSLVEAGQLFTLISLICFLASILILFRMAKIQPFSNTGLLLLVLLFNFFPAKFTLGMGQFNMIILLLISRFLYAIAHKKTTVAGISLASALSLKLFPVFPLVLVVWKKQWQLLKTVVITGITLLALTYVIFGEELIQYFVTAALPSLLRSTPTEYYNQSLAGILGRLHAAEYWRTLISMGLLLTSLWAITKGRGSALLATTHLIVLNLLLNGTAWQHHYVWIIPPLVITFWYIRQQKLGIQYYLLLGLSYFLIALNLKNPNDTATLLQFHVFLGGLLLYTIQIHFLRKTRS